MPTVHDGVGTWYYGKRRIHRLKGACTFCNAVGELESYDTTLFFVLFMIPVLPLGRKRIIDECPKCERHRVISLAKWEKAKTDDIANVLEKLQDDPDDRGHVQAAIACATAYQDGDLFDKVADTLAGDRLDDAEIQAQLGAAYDYFARRKEAEEAYRASLAVEDKPEIREQLALVLLKQRGPDDAFPYLRHVLDQKIEDKRGLIYLLIEAYQAEGRHEEALAFMDARDAAFPAAMTSKDYQKQRAFSEKHLESGKPLKTTLLSESAKAGYREGSHWATRIPRLIFPAILAGLLIWYVGAAMWIGQARKVYLVNGWTKPYTVAINGDERRLDPGVPIPMRVPEGDIAVEFRQQGFPTEPALAHIETSFFSRPFTSPTFVVNPDELAILVWEETEYSAQPQGAGKSEFHAGGLLHKFDGIDYEFESFPQSIKVKGSKSVRKTRVGLSPNFPPDMRMALVATTSDKPKQINYFKRWLQLDPKETIFLYGLIAQLTPEEALAFIKPRLADRPLLVEWHRMYQQFTDKTDPKADLQPEYERLVAEAPGSSDALYLLARIQDVDEAEKLLQQAVTVQQPSAYAFHSLGFHALTQGKFAEATQWTEKAVKLAPESMLFRQFHSLALFANGDGDRLRELAREQKNTGRRDSTVFAEQLRADLCKKDKAQARATIQEAIKDLPDQQKEFMQARLELIVSMHEDNRAEFLKWSAKIPNYPGFVPALVQGKLEDTAAAIKGDDKETAIPERGLLYLAAAKAKNQKVADEQWKELLSQLSKGDRHDRELGDTLSGRRPVNVQRLRRLPVELKKKSVLIAVAAQRFPEQGKELLPLAKTLAFEPEAISFGLRQLM